MRTITNSFQRRRQSNAWRTMLMRWMVTWKLFGTFSEGLRRQQFNVFVVNDHEMSQQLRLQTLQRQNTKDFHNLQNKNDFHYLPRMNDAGASTVWTYDVIIQKLLGVLHLVTYFQQDQDGKNFQDCPLYRWNNGWKQIQSTSRILNTSELLHEKRKIIFTLMCLYAMS